MGMTFTPGFDFFNSETSHLCFLCKKAWNQGSLFCYTRRNSSVWISNVFWRHQYNVGMLACSNCCGVPFRISETIEPFSVFFAIFTKLYACQVKDFAEVAKIDVCIINMFALVGKINVLKKQFLWSSRKSPKKLTRISRYLTCEFFSDRGIESWFTSLQYKEIIYWDSKTAFQFFNQKEYFEKAIYFWIYPVLSLLWLANIKQKIWLFHRLFIRKR